jgi:hypothetical protein
MKLGDKVWSPSFGKGIVVRKNTAWDLEVLYRINTGSLLYYGMAWGHNLSGERYEPPLLIGW